MRKCVYIIMLFFVLTGCQPKKFTYTDLSEYTIDTAALKDQELVSIIYFSGGPDYNNEQKYYYRYIVVSESTGDTVNVLSSVRTDVDLEAPIKRFLNPNAENAITIDNLLELAQRTQGKGNYKKHDITRVINNRDFKNVEKNNYPYIVGLFAEFNALE